MALAILADQNHRGNLFNFNLYGCDVELPQAGAVPIVDQISANFFCAVLSKNVLESLCPGRCEEKVRVRLRRGLAVRRF